MKRESRIPLVDHVDATLRKFQKRSKPGTRRGGPIPATARKMDIAGVGIP
jgi:hypothetical protein